MGMASAICRASPAGSITCSITFCESEPTAPRACGTATLSATATPTVVPPDDEEFRVSGGGGCAGGGSSLVVLPLLLLALRRRSRHG